jgi:hypothetical protein
MTRAPAFLNATRVSALARRNDKIAAAYRAGDPIELIARRWHLPKHRVSRIARAEGVALRCPRVPGAAQAFIAPEALARAEIAAKARGVSLDNLVTRLANAALSDLVLIDNVLDDGVETEARP